MTQLACDSAAVLRSVGLIRAIAADDHDLAGAILAATRGEVGDELALVRTLYCAGGIAALLLQQLTPDGDSDRVLDDVQRLLVLGEAGTPV